MVGAEEADDVVAELMPTMLSVVVAGGVDDVANMSALVAGADVGAGTFVEHLAGVVLVVSSSATMCCRN